MERQQKLARFFCRGLLRRLGWAAFVCLAGLALAGPAGAATYSASDAFYWPLQPDYGVYFPSALAVSGDGNLVYVADGMLDHVVEYSSDGVLIRTWPYNKKLGRPTSITTDAFGNVYVLYAKTEMIARFSADGKKILASWNVPFAGAIAASRGGRVYVLTKLLNLVAVYNDQGKAIFGAGFDANLPGQFFPWTGIAPDPGIVPESGYDSPYKTVATDIAVDASGDPVVVGNSYQALSAQEPDCSVAIHEGIDNHPYPDPLVSGEAARFTTSGKHAGWGWLTESPRDCLGGFGWFSDATNPNGVAVDPNSGEVFATSPSRIGVIHLRNDLVNPGQNVNGPCAPYTCSFDWGRITGNPPEGVAVDCHSNLYMLSDNPNARYVTKFVNTDHPQPSSCFNSHVVVPPPSLHVFKLGVGKLGKMHVLAGCSGRLCAGSFALRSSSFLCAGCALTAPHHFRIGAGLQRTLTLQLNGPGRRLLRKHPGLLIKIVGRLKGARSFTQTEALRTPTALGARCSFPGALGGLASLTGTLSPSHGGEQIRVEYLPPQSESALIPAVQHTVRTNRAGHFSDSLALGSAGKWTVFASWSGDRGREAAVALPCSGTVAKAPTRVTLTCPTGSSEGTPSQFSGALSQAEATLGMVYEAPSGKITGRNVTSGGTGNFSDAFSPTEAGTWQVLAHYKGDANHAPAEAVCSFDVAPNDFSISVTPASGAVAPGGSVSATVNTAVTSGTGQTVSLSASGAPGTVTFSPTSVVAGGASNVTFAAPAGAVPGTYAITITGTGPWATHTTTYRLLVR